MASRVIPVGEFDLVVFGASGDLARRKILPALYMRFWSGQITNAARIIGAARANWSDQQFRDHVTQALREFVPEERLDEKVLAEFIDGLEYVGLDAMGEQGWDQLRAKLNRDVVQVFYFSVGPNLFGPLAQRLRSWNIAGPQARIVVEKPFGRDLASARALNKTLAEHFSEDQIYRIDHYLGKETVQNLMAVRFANILFEPLWKSEYVDHVQITVAETVGVSGRGTYYDKSGAMRDMVQNHIMQLLCLIAMEPPHQFEPNAVRDEKLKVIRALDPVEPHDIVRGQYGAGQGTGPDAGSEEASYLTHVDNQNSLTESYIALRVGISNWRWKGTPFYLRTGKRLRARESEIAITFRKPPHSIFGDDRAARENVLIIRLQPDEGMKLKVMIKEPGPGGMRLMEVPLDMSFADALGETAADIPDAYERLIVDVIRGNQTLFMRGDEVEAAWAWTDPIIEGWKNRGERPQIYDPGTSGPDDALMLMHRDGRRWREIRA